MLAETTPPSLSVSSENRLPSCWLRGRSVGKCWTTPRFPARGQGVVSSRGPERGVSALAGRAAELKPVHPPSRIRQRGLYKPEYLHHQSHTGAELSGVSAAVTC